MSAKSIHEADGKAILSYHLTRAPVISPSPLPAPSHNAPPKLASITFPADASPAAILDAAEQTYPWLLEQGAKFVAKPDQLIKRRGKAGLLALNKSWADARAWIEEKAGKEVKVETVNGYLRTFLVEPFCPHKPEEEYYICIHSEREVSFPVFGVWWFWCSPDFDVANCHLRERDSLYPPSPRTRSGRTEENLVPRTNVSREFFVFCAPGLRLDPCTFGPAFGVRPIILWQPCKLNIHRPIANNAMIGRLHPLHARGWC